MSVLNGGNKSVCVCVCVCVCLGMRMCVKKKSMCMVYMCGYGVNE